MPEKSLSSCLWKAGLSLLAFLDKYVLEMVILVLLLAKDLVKVSLQFLLYLLLLLATLKVKYFPSQKYKCDPLKRSVSN